MRVCLLASGSNGNACLLEVGTQRVLIDLGIGPVVLAKRLRPLGLEPSDITDVLLTSPARAADLRSGDVIVRYGDEKIFSVSDLQHATRGGEVGDPVTVEVLRGDQELRTYLPRGPLGVRLQSARREPDTRR